MQGTGFDIALDRARNILIVRYNGALTLEVAKLALDSAHDDPAVTGDTLVLLDTTRAMVHEIDVQWLRQYQAFKESRSYPAQITALVVSPDEGHQLLGQLWAAIRATSTSRAPGVFTDEAAAIEWLLERRAAGGSETLRA